MFQQQQQQKAEVQILYTKYNYLCDYAGEWGSNPECLVQ
jgi:hypothetical protein